MTRTTLLASIAALVGVAALSATDTVRADASFLPGLYETSVSYPNDGSEVETTRECLTAAEAKQESLERRLAEAVEEGNCKFPQRNIAAGKFAISGTCLSEGVRTSVRQIGTYSPTSMTMSMRIATTAAPGAEPVSVDMQLTSRRVAATCPPGSDND